MRSAKTQALLTAFAVLLLSFFSACGGGSGSNSSKGSGGGGGGGANTQAVVVNPGPSGNYANGVFTTVTVCVPGTNNCANIDGVLVDTGSFGFRVLSSALGAAMEGALPQQTSGGNSNFECAQFVSSVLWGPVKTADITMANHTASSVPIQVIAPNVAPVPAGCTKIGPAEEDLAQLGANGILGIGFFVSDCGPACAPGTPGNPGFYYSCAGSSCSVITESVAQQVSNPVALFPTDNNGVVLQMSPASGNAASSSGSLIFGIGTQSNNALGSAQIFAPDNKGNLQTVYKGTTYPGFLDSGSNAYFFLDSTTSGLPNCTQSTGFYCPSSPTSFSATNNSGSGAAATSMVNFTIGNADQLFTNSSDSVFPTLGGPNAGTFDWGLPFFFGRSVFVAFEPPTGAGPYWAY